MCNAAQPFLNRRREFRSRRGGMSRSYNHAHPVKPSDRAGRHAFLREGQQNRYLPVAQLFDLIPSVLVKRTDEIRVVRSFVFLIYVRPLDVDAENSLGPNSFQHGICRTHRYIRLIRDHRGQDKSGAHAAVRIGDLANAIRRRRC